MSDQQKWQGLSPEYKKSRRSMNDGRCLEARCSEDGGVDVRDTEHRDLGALKIAPDAWGALVGVLGPRGGRER